MAAPLDVWDCGHCKSLAVSTKSERESCDKLELTHTGESTSKNIGYLAIPRAIDAGVGGVSQVGVIEGILCLYLKLHGYALV
jgi:hypothetical protein